MVGGFVDFIMLVIGCDAPVEKCVAQTVKHLDCRSKEFPMVVDKTDAVNFGAIILRWRDKNTLNNSRRSHLIEVEEVPAQFGTKPLKISIVFEFLPNVPVLNELKLGNCCCGYH